MQLTVTGKDADFSRLANIFGAVAAIVVGLTILLGATATPAAAHAVLLDSSPEDGQRLDEAPEVVELHFNEQVQPIDGAFQLFPSTGEPLELEAHATNHDVIIDLPAGLDDDAYAVSWRVISADAHPMGGAVSFQVGDATALPADIDGIDETSNTVGIAVGVLTALMYFGLLAMTGLIVFHHLVLRPPVSKIPNDRYIVWAMYFLAVAAALLLIPLTAIHNLGGEIGSLLQPDSWASQVGWQPATTALVIGLMGAAAALFATQPGNVVGFVSVVAALLAVSAPVFVGHTQTIQPGWVMLPADIAHLVAGALWVGGIIGLVRYLVYATRTTPAHHAVVVVNRFSTLALGSVILLVISGGLMALLILDSFAEVVETGYGQTLLVKVGMVGVAIVLAALNRFHLLPALEKHAADTDRWTRLHRILRYEAIFLVGVVAITGFLTNQAPQREASNGGEAQVVDINVESQGLTATGQFEPGLTGQNTLTFKLAYEGEPLSPEEMTVEARLPAQDLGPFIDEPEVSDQGDYVADILTPVEGEWEVWISVRVDTYTQPRVQIPITIGEP